MTAVIRCSSCVDLHRPCAECEEWAREAAEDLALAESGAYVGEFVRAVRCLIGADEAEHVANIAKKWAPSVIEHAGQRIVRQAIDGAFRLVRREYEGTSEEAEAHARRIIS